MAHPLVTKEKSWFRSPWIAVVLMVFVVLGIISVIHAFAKERTAINLRDQSQAQLNDLNAKQADLSQSIQNLSTPRGIEGEVRDQFRVVKPGEQLVIVVDNGSANPPAAPENFWDKLFKFVGF